MDIYWTLRIMYIVRCKWMKDGRGWGEGDRFLSPALLGHYKNICLQDSAAAGREREPQPRLKKAAP